MADISAGSSYTLGDTGDTANAGRGHAHNNMPPYLVVNMWQRTG